MKVYNPDISVIIPVYNAELYLDSCIQSVLNQQFEKFELILVNDGSTDESPNICDQWATRDSRIKVIHKENKGVSDTRNVGVRASAGEYISFVDSDDFIEPDMLTDLFRVAKETNADMIIGQYCREETYLSKKPIKNPPVIYEGNDRIRILFENQNVERTSIIANWGKLYRKSLFTSIEFPVGRVYEDESTVHKFLLSSRKVVLLDYPYYHYVWRPNSIVTGRSIQSFLDKQIALSERIDDFVNTEFIAACVKYYYAYCVDFIIEMFSKDLTHDNEKLCMVFIDQLLSRRKLVLLYIPWHQRICIALLSLKNKTLIRWLAKESFAPGRNLFYSIKTKLKR